MTSQSENDGKAHLDLPSERPGDETSVSLSLPIIEEEAIPFSLGAQEQLAIKSLPAGSALLIVQKGQAGGARFLLDAEKIIAGRSEKADIFLDDVTVSRKHAEFLRSENQFFVRDIGSLNGTYVNRERIDHRSLSAGDEVQIGKYRMLFYPSISAYTHTAGADE